MKKTLVSLAAASLIVTSAMAADKGIDIVTTGQAVVYYETHGDNGKGAADIFDQSTSQANVGVQLNLAADLKNNYTFGSQVSYLGTAGLEKNLVSGVKQDSTLSLQSSTTDQLALTKIFVAKKAGNTTVKLGRQELPKSLSPFAFSEGWRVFKNTFESVLVVNTDIPDTTIVGAYVSGGTGHNISSTGNLTPAVQGLASPAGGVEVDGTAYMLTIQNKSIPMTTITASYYDVANVNADSNASDSATNSDIKTGGAQAIWIDAKVAGKDLPMGLSIGLQGGKLFSDFAGIADTTAYGAKIGLKPIDALSLSLAYSSVDGDDNKMNIAVKNFGTAVKTPLYTQMVYNQDAIALDANTFVIKAVYNTGDYGKVIAQYGATSGGQSNLMYRNAKDTDYGEFDLIYKVKAAGVQYFAAYINRSWSEVNNVTDKMDNDNKIRVWARLNF
jgi:hypothetical protein